MEIEINGIKYQEKEQNKSTKRLPYSVLAALAFASFDPFLPKQKSFNPPNVNIITEYEAKFTSLGMKPMFLIG